MSEVIRKLLLNRKEIIDALIENIDLHNTIISVARETFLRLTQGNKVFFCGNGGSATDADHLAGELIGRFYQDREPMPAIVLHQSLAATTAISNDYGYEHVFARQLKALGKKNDVLWAFSTSGKSPNVLKAIETAKNLGIMTVGFTGAKGTQMAQLCDYAIIIPSEDTPIIQEGHKIIGHIICQLIEKQLLNNSPHE